MSIPPPRDLEETYLPAFRATVTEGHVQSVMCAYNSIDEWPACTNKMLLKDHLRDAWGFKGFVVSDCGAIVDVNQGHKKTPDITHSAALSLAGRHRSLLQHLDPRLQHPGRRRPPGPGHRRPGHPGRRTALHRALPARPLRSPGLQPARSNPLRRRRLRSPIAKPRSKPPKRASFCSRTAACCRSAPMRAKSPSSAPPPIFCPPSSATTSARPSARLRRWTASSASSAPRPSSTRRAPRWPPARPSPCLAPRLGWIRA